jgi:hypothetical protein
VESTQRVYGLGLPFVSARTNKRHHHDQQTAPPQSRCSKDVTAHAHLPRARPGRPYPVPACSGQPLPSKRRFSSPLLNRMDFHGDNTATCTTHSGATKAHDWMVSVLGPLFRTAGHTVRTQHGVTVTTGQRRCDVEIHIYLRDQAVSRSLGLDLSITHHSFGSSSHVHQNGLLSYPQDLDVTLCLAAHRKINNYRQQYVDNQNISFLPAIMSTSTCMHGEFLRLFFLQAHRETESHFTDDDVFYLFLQKQKIGAKLHVYPWKGTYHKWLFRGPSTNDMKK